jgi:hypothetical protein
MIPLIGGPSKNPVSGLGLRYQLKSLRNTGEACKALENDMPVQKNKKKQTKKTVFSLFRYYVRFHFVSSSFSIQSDLKTTHP